MKSTIGMMAISPVRNTVPMIDQTRDHARRQTAPKRIGRPRTASWSTTGTAACTTAEASR